MKICPECLTNTCPDQRDGAKRDARCLPCRRELFRRRRLAEQYYDAWYERALA